MASDRQPIDTRRVTIRWQRLYRRIEEGLVINALIGYGTRPYMQKYLPETDETIITQWARTLFIDLWIVKMRFDWLTKEKTDGV